ncbi:MAG: hypothetical protein DRI48_04565 [Chloroflexi bacterium]|nr:MAG: hypothetical protein DRI48_04565 [Chloroflexota bacterium]
MSTPTRQALFADLVFNEEGQPVKVVDIGNVPHYAVPEGDFLRHVEAEYVDRQIVTLIQQRLLEMRDVITEGVIQMLGQEDLFTRASIEHAIEHMDRILEPGAVDVDELRTTLWMTGFRATINVHGDVLNIDIPGWEGEE